MIIANLWRNIYGNCCPLAGYGFGTLIEEALLSTLEDLAQPLSRDHELRRHYWAALDDQHRKARFHREISHVQTSFFRKYFSVTSFCCLIGFRDFQSAERKSVSSQVPKCFVKARV